MELSNVSRIESAVTPTAGVAATTAINGSVHDLGGADGALFIVRMGAITASAVTSIKIQHGDVSTLSDAADLTGTSQTIADTDGGKIFVVDLVKPVKRYARLVVSRGIANAVVAAAETVVYGVRLAPQTQPTGTTIETWVSPVTGTA